MVADFSLSYMPSILVLLLECIAFFLQYLLRKNRFKLAFLIFSFDILYYWASSLSCFIRPIFVQVAQVNDGRLRSCLRSEPGVRGKSGQWTK